MSTEKIAEQINEVLSQDVVDRHSYFQLKYFVVGKEPTMQSKMWRCIRELKTRWESMQAITLEIDETNDLIELIDVDIEQANGPHHSLFGMDEAEDDFSKKRREIKTRQLTRKKLALATTLNTLRDKLRYAEDEALFFLNAFKALEKVEPLKTFDDMEAQKEYWNAKFNQKIQLEAVLGIRPDTELVTSILSLHNDAPVKMEVVKMIEDHQKRSLQAKEEDAKLAMAKKKDRRENKTKRLGERNDS